MRKRLFAPALNRVLAIALAALTALPLPAQTPAEAPAPKQLNIVILEGEGAINNVRQRVARESIVQVEDENHKPVAGAAVTFFLPGDGPSGVFPNGSRSITVLTDEQGKAAARGVKLNKLQGRMQIRVSVSFQGLTSSAVISQTSMVGAAAAGAGGATAGGVAAGGGISGKMLAIILIVAAGGAAGGVAAATGGGGGSKTPAATPVSVTPGTPSVGPPH
jgi:hypothetical protein